MIIIIKSALRIIIIVIKSAIKNKINKNKIK